MIKRSGTVAAIALILCALTLLVSCTGGSETAETTTTENQNISPESTVAEYKVNIVDHSGAPVSDVIVTILQNGEAKGMKVAKQGSAIFTLEKGDYTVELSFTGSPCYYDKADLTMSAEKTEITVSIFDQPKNSTTIYAYSESADDHVAFEAYELAEGGYYVNYTAGRSYFLFAPQRGGTFEVEYTANADLELGYYGSTFNVLTENQAERDGEKIILGVKNSMIGSVWVIGVDAEAAGAGVIRITRVGDPPYSITDEPWNPYIESNPVDYFAECENKSDLGFEFIDLTDKELTVVLNAQDGYYHLNSADGPLVYIALGTDSKYISSIKTICENQRMGVYIYDADGNFVRKESYNELFEQYSYGTVPLTEKLAYAVKAHGEYNKWWDLTSQQHIFGDDYATVNVNNAWLFCCGTISSSAVNEKGSDGDPVRLPKLSSDGEEIPAQLYMQEGKTYHIQLDAVSGRKLIIERVNSNITVSYNGETYKASSGILEITLVSGAKELTVSADSEDYVSISCEIISNG